MGALRSFESRSAMASRWRRRRMCVLIADTPSPAALRTISATTALLETNAQPPVGSRVELRHPEAGAIEAVVCSLSDDGVKISFDYGERSVAFALAAIAADMSRPAS